MTWYEANDACMALDPDGQATLSSVKTQEENDYIQSLPLIFGYYAWLGGTDSAPLSVDLPIESSPAHIDGLNVATFEVYVDLNICNKFK